MIPTVLRSAPDALKSTVAEVKGKSGTVGGTDAGPGETPAAAQNPGRRRRRSRAAEGAATAAPAPAAKGEPLDIKLDGLKPMGDTEFYNADNLFEKIDGRAPAYLNFNVQGLRCRSFSVTGTAGSFVDVYEYRFDTPVNAFGMFSLERDPKGGPLAFAPDGYVSGMGFFFRQGPRYVQVMASDQNAKDPRAGQGHRRRSRERPAGRRYRAGCPPPFACNRPGRGERPIRAGKRAGPGIPQECFPGKL